ncbi:hypothetical protein [Pseudogracilibacillus sp. SO30301A]|uniref:hypothetical protein n=1 Tax=Pseudogracilibacillus sp. SO30301A TaxID=3098291 RepID=UPI00300E3184
MSLEIKVEPDTVKSLAEQARKVPNEQIDQAIEKLTQLEGDLSSWKGEGPSGHEEAVTELKRALTSSKDLFTAILATLDHAIDQFTEADQEISDKFERRVKNHLS